MVCALFLATSVHSRADCRSLEPQFCICGRVYMAVSSW